jgi:hypothetical protein
MPEDIPPVDIPPEAPPEAPPENVEEVQEQVEELEYTLEDMCADMLNRIDMLDERVQALHERFTGYATSEHSHGSTAEPTTSNNGAGNEHQEQNNDEQPTPTHFYFRRLGE